MSAPANERMMTERMTRIMGLVLVISIGFLVPKAAAQSDKYPEMAPINQYLMKKMQRFCWRGAALRIQIELAVSGRVSLQSRIP